MEILDSEYNFGKIDLRPILIKTFVSVQSATHVSARGIIQNQEKLLWSLECKFETDNEWMSHIS